MRWLINMLAGDKIKELQERAYDLGDKLDAEREKNKDLELQLKIAKMYIDDDDALLELVGLAKDYSDKNVCFVNDYTRKTQELVDQRRYSVLQAQAAGFNLLMRNQQAAQSYTGNTLAGLGLALTYS